MSPVQRQSKRPLKLPQALAAERTRINRWLDRLVPRATHYPPSIHRAIRYCLLPGGKRLRPILCIWGYRANGGRTTAIYPTACAVELVHTFSLIHDDLPALDNDDLRRGQPTCHRVFGEGIALLAGDALLARAFEILGELPERWKIAPTMATRLVGELARAVGTEGMIGGQVLDLEAQGRELTEEDVGDLYGRKTAALFTTSLRMGGLLAGASPLALEALTGFGERLGVAFQIVDDLHDLSADTSGEAGASKATLPTLMGVQAARERAAVELHEAQAILGEAGIRNPYLLGLADHILALAGGASPP